MSVVVAVILVYELNDRFLRTEQEARIAALILEGARTGDLAFEASELFGADYAYVCIITPYYAVVRESVRLEPALAGVHVSMPDAFLRRKVPEGYWSALVVDEARQGRIYRVNTAAKGIHWPERNACVKNPAAVLIRTVGPAARPGYLELVPKNPDRAMP